MKKSLYILITLLISFFKIGYNQNLHPVFENFSEQLPSTESHDLYQDSLGYIWIATDRGISKYDGLNFRTINTQKLNNNCVFNFKEESKNKIWINTGNNELFFFNPLSEKTIFTPYKHNQTLRSALYNLNGNYYIRKFHFNTSKTLFVSYLIQGGHMTIDDNGQPTYFHSYLSPINLEKKNDIILPKNHQIIIHLNDTIITTESTLPSSDNQLIFINHATQDTHNISKNFPIKTLKLCGISDYKRLKDETLIIIGSFLISTSESNIKTLRLPNEGLKILPYDDMYIISSYKGAHLVDKNLTLKQTFFKEDIITSAIKDQYGGLWLSSAKNGIFHIKNINLQSITNTSHIDVKYIDLNSEHTLLLDDNKTLYFYDSANVPTYKQNSITVRAGFIVSATEKIPLLKKYYFQPIGSRQMVYCTILDSTVLLPRSYGFSYYNASNKQENKIQTKKIKVKDCIIIGKNKHLFSSHNGLYTMDSLKITKIKGSNNINFNRIHNSIYGQVIASNKGVFLLKNSTLFNLNKSHGLLDNNIKNIHIQNDSILWVSTHRGINKIYFNDKSLEIKEITTKNGLPVQATSYITSDKTHIWIGTKQGALKLDNSYSPSSTETKPKYFILDSIILDSKRIDVNKTISVPHKHRLTFHYKYINYLSTQHNIFEYKIDQTKWLLANESTININNLNPGLHNLTVRTFKENQIVYANKIHVLVPFYFNFWFIVSTSLILITIIFLVIRAYFKAKDKKKEVKIDKLRLELKLLTSQMNPHFTFNTINSIQNYILKKDKKDAILYLSDFALLIRKSLDFSFNDYITIQEELNFLKLYIGLENKRFDSNFLFTTQIAESINAKTDKIPSLLLQPLIENIILHANYKPKEEKRILVHVDDLKEYYKIKIVDYGAGISKKNNSISKHKSYGLEIIRNRLKIYNGANHSLSDLLFEHTDKVNQTGNTTTLKLYKNEYNHH